MTEVADPTAVEVIDCAVHPAFTDAEELREHLPEPWRSRAIPAIEPFFYPAPGSATAAFASVDDGAPGSDPETLRRHVLDEPGARAAVLVPLTRGLIPDVDLGSAICAATNDWLAARWLGERDGRTLHGSIRVNPADAAGAVREIERWAGHPNMVQIAVPLQAHRPYGQRCYTEIWSAAQRHGLPVFVHRDASTGIDFWPTCVGYPTHHLEDAAQYPLNYIVHLFSFIAEGVFERLPELDVVFGDGGLDVLMPLIWRFDKDWRPARAEVPWVTRAPSDYVRERVRFCAHRDEGPPDAEALADWLQSDGLEDLLLFASNYPSVDHLRPDSAFSAAPAQLRAKVLGGNARQLYRL